MFTTINSLKKFLFFLVLIYGITLTHSLESNSSKDDEAVKKLMEYAHSRADKHPYYGDYDKLEKLTRNYKFYYYDESGDLSLNAWHSGMSPRLPIFFRPGADRHFTMRVCLSDVPDNVEGGCGNGFFICYTGQMHPGNNHKIKPQFQLTNKKEFIAEKCAETKGAGTQHGIQIGTYSDNGKWWVDIQTSFGLGLGIQFQLPEDRCFNINFGSKHSLLTNITTTTDINDSIYKLSHALPDMNNGGLFQEAYNRFALTFMDMTAFTSELDNQFHVSMFGKSQMTCLFSAKILSIENVEPCKAFWHEFPAESLVGYGWVGGDSTKNISTDYLKAAFERTMTVIDDSHVQKANKSGVQFPFLDKWTPAPELKGHMALWFYCGGSLFSTGMTLPPEEPHTTQMPTTTTARRHNTRRPFSRTTKHSTVAATTSTTKGDKSGVTPTIPIDDGKKAVTVSTTLITPGLQLNTQPTAESDKSATPTTTTTIANGKGSRMSTMPAAPIDDEEELVMASTTGIVPEFLPVTPKADVSKNATTPTTTTANEIKSIVVATIPIA